jgi:hypothetical protein
MDSVFDSGVSVYLLRRSRIGHSIYMADCIADIIMD